MLRLGALVLLAAHAGASNSETICASGKMVSLSIGVQTNRTGHTLVQGRVKEPTDNATWQMDLDLERVCNTGLSPSKILTFKLADASNSFVKLVPPGYKRYPDMGYFRVSTDALTWAAAKEACAREGAQLTVAASHEEINMYVQEFSFAVPGTAHGDCSWYGANDIAQEGQFVTVAGMPLTISGFAKFGPSQPNGGTGENCVLFYKTTRVLEDYPCSKALAYICKIPL